MRPTHRSRRPLRAVLPLLAAALAALVYTAAPRERVFASGDGLSAKYVESTLRVSVPYDETVARSRTLRVEILAPDDKPIAESTKNVAPSREAEPWEVSLTVDKNIPLEDLV